MDIDRRLAEISRQNSAPLPRLVQAPSFESFSFRLSSALRAHTNDASETHKLLNGAAYQALRESISRIERQAFGMFFTDSNIADRVTQRIKGRLADGATVGDPACGAGDLLLACLQHMPVNLPGRASKLFGVELHPDLTTTAQKRLLLAEISAGESKWRPHRSKIRRTIAKNISTSDFLADPSRFRNLDCVVMNPPFGSVQSSESNSWAGGRVQKAAVFLWELLRHANDGQEIVAVLPEVLRGGSRYHKWRKSVESIAAVKSIEPLGRFDKETDVDVFLLHLKKTGCTKTSKFDWIPPTPTLDALHAGQFFRISVGAVVPHRASGEGPKVRFLDSRGAEQFGEVQLSPKLRFNGSKHKGPFVVVRRTSSPSDKRRLVVSLYSGSDEIAVENHLIVFQSHDESVKMCEAFFSLATQGQFDQWLNERSRCRHLTTTCLKTLPLPSGFA